MLIVNDIKALREQLTLWRKASLTIAFVPTMGNLHDGHYSLVEKAKTLADKVVVSIFVNPMQFGKNEDLDNYPRTIEQDNQGLQTRGTDAVFIPSVADIYPNGLAEQSYVDVPGVSLGFCGGTRPGHFKGVATVVTKLFNMVQPDIACFGEKDYQQLQVIKTMVQDLSMPIDIVGVPTKREPSGLAMSSRNGYLTDTQKHQASILYATLMEAASALKSGEKNYLAIEETAKTRLSQHGLKPDYFSIAQKHTLQLAKPNDTEFVILAAAFLGSVRLIDNIQVGLNTQTTQR
jgi:pantoate--beta-alanine ligase